MGEHELLGIHDEEDGNVDENEDEETFTLLNSTCASSQLPSSLDTEIKKDRHFDDNNDKDDDTFEHMTKQNTQELLEQQQPSPPQQHNVNEDDDDNVEIPTVVSNLSMDEGIVSVLGDYAVAVEQKVGEVGDAVPLDGAHNNDETIEEEEDGNDEISCILGDYQSQKSSLCYSEEDDNDEDDISSILGNYHSPLPSPSNCSGSGRGNKDKKKPFDSFNSELQEPANFDRDHERETVKDVTTDVNRDKPDSTANLELASTTSSRNSISLNSLAGNSITSASLTSSTGSYTARQHKLHALLSSKESVSTTSSSATTLPLSNRMGRGKKSKNSTRPDTNDDVYLSYLKEQRHSLVQRRRRNVKSLPTTPTHDATDTLTIIASLTKKERLHDEDNLNRNTTAAPIKDGTRNTRIHNGPQQTRDGPTFSTQSQRRRLTTLFEI